MGASTGKQHENIKSFVAGVLAAVTQIFFFYLTTALLSYVYDMDQALLTFKPSRIR